MKGNQARRRRAEGAAEAGRDVALNVLRRVLKSNLFLPALLEREMASHPLPPEERRLATQLAYGCVRMRATLDRVIEQCSGRKMSRISHGLHDILRIALYQILFLDRIPAYAAVNEAVEMAKRHGPAGAEGFVNAVLRRAPRRPEDIELPPGADEAGRLAVAHSFPVWLVERWMARYGAGETEALCRAQNRVPPLTVRVNVLKCSRRRLIDRLEAEGAAAAANTGHPLAVDITRLPASLEELPSFREGMFQVQDVSAMRVVDLLAPRRGETIADLCAAPGGKATAVAEKMADDGRLFCLDRSEKKVRLVAENARRLGIRCIRCRRGDARRAREIFKGRRVDRVIVDAPCSNTGVLGRRPEARWRLKEKDIARLAVEQIALLRAAAQVVRPGGILVYSTCSMEPEENEEVVKEFLLDDRSFLLVRELRFLPHRDGCDGGYAARMEKVRK